MDANETDQSPHMGERGAAPTSIEEVSDYLTRITAELNERKAAADEAANRLVSVEQAAQDDIDEVTRKALLEVREVQRRTAAEINDAQTRLTGQVEAASKERDEASACYVDAIDKVVASGLVARKLLTSMGFSAPRSKAKPKPVTSKIKPKDLDGD